MGDFLTYHCKNCNYQKTVMIGGGLYSLRTNLVPALNKAKKEVTCIDVNAPVANLENYVLYSDLTLNKKPFFRFMPDLLQPSPHPLLAKYNFCPKCEKHKLSCDITGVWD